MSEYEPELSLEELKPQLEKLSQSELIKTARVIDIIHAIRDFMGDCAEEQIQELWSAPKLEMITDLNRAAERIKQDGLYNASAK